MRASIVIRQATAADAPLLADHRVGMFRDMGAIEPEWEGTLRDRSIAYFTAAIPAGEYVGWVACLPDDATPIAGAGVQIRSLLPRPAMSGDGLLLGHEGLVLNVYTNPEWRGRGVARQMMDTIIAWSAAAGIVRLVLSASAAGRPLYEKMGFVATREMAYSGPLAPVGPWTGA
jgi:GNAT superfamily N-acetyltransferase